MSSKVDSKTTGNVGTPDTLSAEREQLLFNIWAKAVDTQMHFNEMSGKSRQLGLTFVVASLGLAVVLFTRDADFRLGFEFLGLKGEIYISVLIIAVATFGLYAVQVLDLGVYHKTLRGAVAFGEDFERNYMSKIFQLNKGMTEAISHFSRFTNASVETKDGKYIYKGTEYVTAFDKIRRFYRLSIWTLVVIFALSFVATGSLTTTSGFAFKIYAVQKHEQKPK